MSGGLLAGLLLWPAAARASRDDELIAHMQDRIKMLTGLMAERTDPAEKERLGRRLEAVKRELAIVERRQAIDTQERKLQTLVLIGRGPDGLSAVLGSESDQLPLGAAPRA